MPRNSLRSEGEAYRFLIVAVGFFVVFVVVSLLGGHWDGLAAFLALAVIGLTWHLRRAPTAVVVWPSRRRLGALEQRRVLVIANETLTGELLHEEIRRAASGYRAEVLVVCPALNSRLRYWASDNDRAQAAARHRLDESLGGLRRAGIEAYGEIGDSNPLQAIEDALRVFAADEIAISTHPEGYSNWLERGIVPTARERFAVPVTHVAQVGAAATTSSANSETGTLVEHRSLRLPRPWKRRVGSFLHAGGTSTGPVEDSGDA